MLAPILHPASSTWLLGRIENHTVKPMTRAEVEAHIEDYNRLRALCDEQAALIKEVVATLRDIRERSEHAEKTNV